MFPNVKIGVLVARNLNNSNEHQNFLDLIRRAEKDVREKYQLEGLAALPKIADWREAYRKFGFKPSSHRSSIEALMRRILKGKSLPAINPIVDIYNFISIEYILPVGGDDIDQIDGDIMLTIADGTERFIMLGSDKPEEIKKGEVIYRDDREVLCRAWNYRECDKSKITTNTKNVCLVVEGLEHTSEEEVLKGLSRLKELLVPLCKGTFQEFLLHKNNLEAFF
ncbi:MAG: Phenylalanine--tRNA ligase beta subunit [Candidatus Anoxychlamydiales bacterium]|nr:Phenylalanine--tRNA ligase beta subunit [Candidatus Anoxychlamydiales bacterium]NGX41606.1 Phenylalanine--tRNA ligase beta subunit [Candidatus Anoxychlamydiales bacterium]HEU63843.1 hypothetical protein [Chlamydiota bacterium]